MKKILISLVAIVLAVSGYFGYQYLSKSDEQKMLEKYDLDGLTVVEIVNTLDQQSNELESLNAQKNKLKEEKEKIIIEKRKEILQLISDKPCTCKDYLKNSDIHIRKIDL